MIDPQQCERARLARDARFDGLFFTGVLSTGIYCRPICPAPAPKPENVVYFPSAAAAAEAGLRPCLRCRPETSPGTPAWNGTSSVVARGLTLIRQGALNDGSTEELAHRLGVGSRHLRRLFQDHVGAPPKAIATTQRVQFAKQLVDETDMPITQVAFAAGFGSIRRFNAAFRKVYAQSPSQVRRKDKRTDPQAPERFKCLLTLPYRPPYDWPGMLAFFRSRAIDGIEWVTERAYRRTIRIGDTRGNIEVRHHERHPALTLGLQLSNSDRLMAIVERVRRLFDLNANMQAIYGTLERDPLLAKAITKHPGLRLPGAWDPFEIALRAMVGQQISVKAARTVCSRLVTRAGREVAAGGDGKLTHYFPTAGELSRTDLAQMGLTNKRREYLTNLCRAVDSGAIQLTVGGSLSDCLERLTALPGIGPWTANYIAMRALGEPDAFPAEDLGVIKRLRGDKKRPSRKEVLARAEAWRPWRAYAVIYLWS